MFFTIYVSHREFQNLCIDLTLLPTHVRPQILLRCKRSLQTAGRSDADPRNKEMGPVKKPSALETFSSNAGLMKSLRTCHLASSGAPKSRSQPSISGRPSVRKNAATAKSSSNAHIFYFAAFLFVFCWCMLIQLNKTRLGDASKVLNDVVIQRVRPRPCVVNANFTMIR